MPIINLIQEQRLAEVRRGQGVRMALFVLMGTVATGFFFYAILMFQRASLLAENVRLEDDIKRNEPIMRQIDAVNAESNQLKPKLQTLTDAQLVSGRWEDILTRLETQMPADSWLSNLSCPPVSDDKTIQIVFNGTARAQQPISEFILRAQNQPDLQNVTLHFTAEKRAANEKRLVDFEAAADIKDSAAKSVELEQKS